MFSIIFLPFVISENINVEQSWTFVVTIQLGWSPKVRHPRRIMASDYFSYLLPPPNRLVPALAPSPTYSARFYGGEWSSICKLEENYGRLGMKDKSLFHYVHEGENCLM